MIYIKKTLPNEEWRYVKDFEGIYAVSSQGRLASNKRGAWRILSNVNTKGDYFSVVLQYKGKIRYTRMHRLVYEAFVGEIPKGYKFHIHHINGDKQDNCVKNLKLVTCAEHYYEDIETRTYEALNYYNQHVRPSKVAQYSMSGMLIAIYDNAKEAYKATGVCARSIKHVCNGDSNGVGGTYKSAGGYLWKNVD